MAKTDPRVTKLRVTMRNADIDPISGEPRVIEAAVDYVRPDILDAYLADARPRWQSVTVSEEPDAGPGGYHGATFVPAHLDHPLAGQAFDATQED